MKKEYARANKKKTIPELKKSISKKNLKLIKQFLDIKRGSVTDKRIQSIEYSLIPFADLLEKDFDKATKDEITKAWNVILQSNISVRTQQDDYTSIRMAFRYWFGDDEYFPKQVAGMKRPSGKGRLKLPDEMPTEDFIFKMIKACNNSRDKFWIALSGLDGALRPIEQRNIKWGDIKKDKHGHFIVIKTAKESGDKATRTIRIIKSEPYFIKWCEEYPKDRNDNNFVFINYSDLKPLQKGAIESLFKRLKKKLNYNQKLYPYLMRHQLLTKMSKDPNVSVSVLKKFAGHTERSNIIGDYQHFGDDDIKDMQLQYNGKKKKQDVKVEKEPIKCFKCKKLNVYDAEFCSFCNQALSQKRMVETNDKLAEDVSQLKGIVSEIIGEVEGDLFKEFLKMKTGLISKKQMITNIDKL